MSLDLKFFYYIQFASYNWRSSLSHRHRDEFLIANQPLFTWFHVTPFASYISSSSHRLTPNRLSLINQFVMLLVTPFASCISSSSHRLTPNRLSLINQFVWLLVTPFASYNASSGHPLLTPLPLIADLTHR